MRFHLPLPLLALAAVATPPLLPSVAAAQSATPTTPAAQKSAFTAEDLVRLRRLSDPQVSPDGRWVAFTLRETDVDANRGRTDVWLLEIGAKAPLARRLTQSPAADSSPRWAPDGRSLFFLSTRSGSSQVWRLPLAGGEALQVTDYPLDVGTLKVSPRGDRLAVTLEVFPDCAELACSAGRLEARKKDKRSGLAYEQLFVRHWDTWADGTLSTLFTAPLDADGKAGAPVAVSAKVRGHVPSKPMGGDEEYEFSPDGTRLVFSARLADRVEPWSTNFDLYEVPVDGSAPPRNLTGDNAAWDTQPVFLANGDLAWLAMRRPGFEADRFRVLLRDARSGTTRVLAGDWDRSVSRLGTSADRRQLLATADDLGQVALFSLDPAGGRPTKLVGEGQVAEYSAVPGGGVLIAWASLGAPADLYVATRAGAPPRRLTTINAAILEQRAMAPYEQFSFRGWNDETVYGYVMKPHGWQPGRRYPIAFLVHGGPQVSFQNQWSFRWNAQAFAGRGYAVVFIDFHGSPGYGQAFTDSISQDWGGKPFVDLQKGFEAAVAKYDWLDGDRACSLGASYGGFMQNWIAGNWPDRFRCIVNHAGIFDTRTMYYTTEELWFTEWENGGPYYAKPELHEKFNPSAHVTKWKTPMLVTHGVLDYRVPYSQGLATFTGLQRQGVESRLLVFPDENHWIQKPANSLQWHEAVFGWLDAHLKR
ncbi:MAG: S9 family peptidase [Steroidobacteraceae bacterium]|jgi:dipeptidyl aminopeptidase/acylaminoacyl peptidase|nr:S9 family peptidase [Steroidobacteraceae bacterium]